ncbi:tRNA lysidine(34) synthetase TilS [Alcanivorax sp. JB21]|uniref:tRNA lysidine(34) synthetase TilS n=1 Tax=Alcanivorax limicola TaxID=2874102 RepID=UPI001CBC3413|nr:tRNA lysidine(34) synthetase TilS [Alcanivorax limicola]MBZ2188387.1 tRNA lysidine(34) synthetase TilS [Alcanivorax limicola]
MATDLPGSPAFADLDARLRALAQDVPGTLVLGYSGGLDSTVLLHALVRAGLAARVLAVHVQHGLQAAADDWCQHCADTAQQLGVAFHSIHLAVPHGPNLEARARDARRAHLLALTPADGALLLAHHADDQAETFLLRLLRGSGPSGLAAMAADSEFAGRRLLRPLLPWRREALADLAARWQLQWVEDPTNAATEADRNFLRHAILPRLAERWPAVVGTLNRDAQLQAEAATLQMSLAEADLVALALPSGPGSVAEGAISLSGLAALPAARQRNLLYGWLRRKGLQAPPRKVLQRVLDEVATALPDRMPEVRWEQGVFCRYRDGLYLLPLAALTPLEGEVVLPLADGARCTLGPLTVTVRAGVFSDVPSDAPSDAFTDELWLPQRLTEVIVGPAAPGARLLLGGLHRDVREGWRAAGIAPWVRRRLPVFRESGTAALLAVAGLGVADGHRPSPGESAWALRWHASETDSRL